MIRSRFEFDGEDPFHICGYHRHLGTMEEKHAIADFAIPYNGKFETKRIEHYGNHSKTYGVIKKPIEKYSKK